MERGIAISLFSGAGGMDLGAEQAGYRAAAAVEIDRDAADTMERNFPTPASPVIRRDILSVPTRELLRAAGLRGRQLGPGRGAGWRSAHAARPIAGVTGV